MRQNGLPMLFYTLFTGNSVFGIGNQGKHVKHITMLDV